MKRQNLKIILVISMISAISVFMLSNLCCIDKETEKYSPPVIDRSGDSIDMNKPDAVQARDEVADYNSIKDLTAAKAFKPDTTKKMISEVFTYDSTNVYSALNLTKFNEILSDSEQLSYIHVIYSNWTNYGSQSPIEEDIGLHLYNGKMNKSLFYSSLDSFKGIYEHGLYLPIPPIEESHERSFTKNEVQVLFDYLVLHADYFFNGAELPETIELEDGPLCRDEYSFTLTIYQPDSQYAWAIGKCTDDPDATWQGLINIINNNFISQF